MPNPTKTIGQLPDNAGAIDGTEQIPIETASGTRRDTLQDLVHGAPADPRYQTADADLTAIAGLSDTGYPHRTGIGSWEIVQTASIPTLITANTTFTVKTSGGDFTSIESALSALANKLISGNATVTIEVDDGTWTITTALTDSQLSSEQIHVVGKNVHSKSVTSIQSTSGSAGNYSIIVNVNSVTNIEVGDYATVLTASGGTNPLHLCGCHEITNVDSANSRLTLESKNKVGVPAGAVTATLTIPKTIIAMSGCHGFSFIKKGLGRLDKLIIKGVGGSTYNGINANMSKIVGLSTASAVIGIANCNFGVALFNGSKSFSRYFAVSGCQQGFFLSGNVTADGSSCAVTGCATGVDSYVGANSNFQGAVITGNTIGVKSEGMSYTLSTATTGVVNNTTNYNPTANTVGNNNAYNDN